jgi:alpha-beta hydrolase superfamily lysophospholipase
LVSQGSPTGRFRCPVSLGRILRKRYRNRKKYPNGNWLTRDDKIWNKYTQDDLCGKTFPVNFYHSFFKNSRKNYKNLKNIPFYLPIFIISGTDDPVPGKNGIIKLFFTYGKANKKVYLKSFLHARHELINETNKKEVYDSIYAFISSDKLMVAPISIV